MKLLLGLLSLHFVISNGGSSVVLSEDARLRSSTEPDVQEKAVLQLIKRKLPDHHVLFSVSVDPSLERGGKDTFRISSPKSFNDSRVHISGSTGVAAAWGFLHYLKYFCKAHVSWEADQLRLPSPLPAAQVKITANDWYRYYENVCTVSYSFVWWDWSRWERHLDWMAMNGINFPLAFTGQEAIWRKVYLDLNVTQEELDEHFAGPAFLAWGRMGNIRGWGGPLSLSWHQKTQELQMKILRRMRDFGMVPILPAFAGHIPRGIIRQFPEANYTRLTAWGHFQDKYTRTYMLNPTDPLFKEIGQRFIQEMQRHYNGTDHAYNCDPFNEMTPPSGSPDYIKAVGEAIFHTMRAADPSAVWVMQAWMLKNTKFWTYERARVLLQSVPQGKLIILDLDADVDPIYARLDSFFGQPFIFCYLGNYGGVDGLYGNVDMLLKNMADARGNGNATLIGTGISSEGINQNYAMYDLFLELAYRKTPFDKTLWGAEYSLRRYGNNDDKGILSKAWKIIMGSVYNLGFKVRYHGNNFLLTHRPNLKEDFKIMYNVSDLVKAWDLFIDACQFYSSDKSEGSFYEGPFINYGNLLKKKSNESLGLSLASNKNPSAEETFAHDLVDITREVLQVYGNHLVVTLKRKFFSGSLSGVRKTGRKLMILLEDLNLLLGTSRSFILGEWLQASQSWASSETEKKQYLTNSLHQISLWGPTGEILDYAVKQWSGVVSQYMKPRWHLFVEELIQCLVNKTHFDQKQFNVDVFVGAEKVFATGVAFPYDSKPQGDSSNIASLLHKKYRPHMTQKFFLRMSKILHLSLKRATREEHSNDFGRRLWTNSYEMI